MFHLIKYSVIRKVKNFSMLFWPCMFPLILGTLLYFAFGNISESDFETVQAAFVEENPGDSVFPSFLEEVSKEETLIHVETMTEKEALQKLEDQKISGIFYGTETPYLKVGKNGLAQSIMQSLLESYLNGKDTLETVADVHPENMKKAVAAMSDYQELVENVSAGGRTTNGNMGFFYALAAMACMYGCFIGLGSAMWLQANLSTLAARQCVSPVHRLKMILTELISSFILHFLNVVILIVYKGQCTVNGMFYLYIHKTSQHTGCHRNPKHDSNLDPLAELADTAHQNSHTHSDYTACRHNQQHFSHTSLKFHLKYIFAVNN